MADPKDDDKLLKEIEDSLFEEFNEQVRLTEPTDSRLQSNIELNPNMAPKKPKEEPLIDEDAPKKKEAGAANKTEATKTADVPDSAKPTAGLDLGDAFTSAVDKDIAKEVVAEAPVETVEKPKSFNPIAIIKFVLAKIKELKILSRAVGLLKKIFFGLFYPFKFMLELTKRQKIYLALIVSAFLAFSYLSWDFYMRTTHPVTKSLYLLSFTEVQDAQILYPEDEKREVFFSPAYTPDYAFVIPKVVANIKRSANSSDKPMVFVELILKASNQETAIEFKDRNIEIQDITARTLEDYDYDTLREQKGLIALRKDVARNINPILNHGIVIDVFYKTFIIKP